MTASKLTVLISALAFIPAAYAHPGHTHSHNFLERVLHAVQTEWLAPVLVAILIGVAGYLYLKRSDSDR